jgi:hypothetical protein
MLRLLDRKANPWAHLAVRNRVRSLKETAELCGISLTTLRRRITVGKGPKVTKLSARRIGVRDDHREIWLDSLAQDRA